MTLLTFRSPVTTPLYRRGESDGVADDDFTITQRFFDPDFYWSNIDPVKAALGHRATDIGNFRCGYPIVAMAAGVARRVQDNAMQLGAPNNALGIVIDHGYGITTEYWHLASWTAQNGPVAAGQEIGKLGNTGLGQICHCHIEGKRDGNKFDPEPLMFGGSITVGQEASDMQIKGTWIRHVHNRFGKVTSDANVRAGVLAGDDEALWVLPAGVPFYPTFVTGGREIGTSADKIEWYGGTCRPTSRSGWVFGYVHSSLLPRTPSNHGVSLDPVEVINVEVVKEVPTGISQQQLLDAALAGRKGGIVDAAKNAADTQ